MTAQKTIQPGTHVVVFRADGQPMEGLILEPPVEYLLPFGEWYVVHRSEPVKYAGKARKRQPGWWTR